MKTIALAVCLFASGCTDKADIGVDSTPITCGQTAAAEAHGSVSTANGYHHDFGTATSSLTAGQQVVQQVADNELILRFTWRCAQPEVATYNVRGDDQTSQIVCPFDLPSMLTGQIQYLPAHDGTVIVDETANCLAGRFHVGLGDAGELDGWFSTPWQ